MSEQVACAWVYGVICDARQTVKASGGGKGSVYYLDLLDLIFVVTCSSMNNHLVKSVDMAIRLNL